MYIVTAEEMYEMDRYAIETGGIPGKQLMENAGKEIAGRFQEKEKLDQQIAIVVGSGNNGGDGFVVARYLKESGFQISVYQVVADEKIRGDAAYHKGLFENIDGSIMRIASSTELATVLITADIVIDAILGIGVAGDIREPVRSMIEAINQSTVRTVSIDIPSGLPANDQVEVDVAIRADYTYIVEAAKQSLFTEPTAIFYGEWEVVHIGIPHHAFLQTSRQRVWEKADVKKTLPVRAPFSHKGSHGRGVVVGGQLTMPGSISLTARASLRAGAGLVTIATIKEVIPAVASQCTEATYYILRDSNGKICEDAVEPMKDFDAIALGMGMGRSQVSTKLVEKIIQNIDKPIIVDADGLYHLRTLLKNVRQKSEPIILTPHYGELAMLTGYSITEIKQAPFTISREFAIQHQVYLVLKGKFTVITEPDGTQMVNDTGNSGLAKGGSGDVLSGILLAMVMKHRHVSNAINNACYIHGKSADLLIEKGHHTEIDLLASDVIEGLSHVFRTLS